VERHSGRVVGRVSILILVYGGGARSDVTGRVWKKRKWEGRLGFSSLGFLIYSCAGGDAKHFRGGEVARSGDGYHRAGEGGEFTRKYQVHRLVYFASFRNVGDAIARETEIKKWRREKKVRLIEERNPTWEDLAEGWGEAAVMRVSGESRFLTGLTPGSE
jgi:hypothetical protein